MIRCPSCSRQVEALDRFCPACGAELPSSASNLPTESLLASVPPRTPSDPHPVRFLPGTMVANRYRIVGLLGRGGMGEVYRADDLKVGQPVALKFLPPGLETDPDRLTRLMTEVRMARQVTHPNVCRVYDVGEAEEQHYISMEYVDGDDLASLLRRIGRMPPDKAVQIARQLCAGLAAAHDQGILHRDLKPSNVILDGRGRVRITDFGLAGVAETFQGGELSAGTPAYMAPEQIQGKQVSVKSDIYALGLLLYELFTGRIAFDARTPAEVARMHQNSAPPTPTTHVPDLDPTIERVILRCIEKDPDRRPSSVLTVAAALPGSDPLAAALAAGETPSPEMVAAAGGEGSLRPAVAIALLLVVLLGAPLVAALKGQTGLLAYAQLDRNPQALAERARQVAADLGYTDRPADRAFGFTRMSPVLEHIAKEDSTPTRWRRLSSSRPGALSFWYRQSPRTMVPSGVAWTVDFDDPPARITGMVNMLLDPEGRLEFFRAVPPQREDSLIASLVADWSALFKAAGLDTAQFTPTDPRWLPESFADQRSAWIGRYPGQKEEIRVEAGAYRGRPVHFDIVHSWDRATRQENPPRTATMQAQLILVGVLNLLIIGGAVFLARRNLRQGRGDRKGAARLGVFVIFTMLAIWVLEASHVPDMNQEIFRFLMGLSLALLNGSLTWVLYIVLEPFVRRRWPQTLVSWSRLLSGRWRDPLVGKHLLYGAAFGVAIALIHWLSTGLPATLGMVYDPPGHVSLGFLTGARWAVGDLVQSVQNSLLRPMILVFLLVVLRMVLRNAWVSLAAFVVVVGFLGLPQASDHLWTWVIANLTWATMVGWVATRFGLVSLMAATFVGEEMLVRLPVTLDFSAWFATTAILALIAAVGLAFFAFRVSLGGRALLRDDLAEA